MMIKAESMRAVGLYSLDLGEKFCYGGVEWVKLDQDGDQVLAIAAEPVFERVFDEDGCNDWRKSSLRQELNGSFLDKLVADGADLAAFRNIASDLTSDDGMIDYGTATDKIALISDALYRKLRTIIPRSGSWWTLTPWTCNPTYSNIARHIDSSGTLNRHYAYIGYGVRPICNLKSATIVYKEELVKAIEEIEGFMNDLPMNTWGTILAEVIQYAMTKYHKIVIEDNKDGNGNEK